MLYKLRTKPIELTIFESLDYRMNLESKDKQHYFNLKKGYEGEVLFDLLTEKLQCECYILNDLLLEFNNTTFQIDSLIITQDKIFFYEVKNHKGNYYYDSGKLYKKPNIEILNPLDQLSRSESLFRQLLLHHGYNFPVESSVVFINPNFTLYQAPLDKPIIFPTQVENHLNQINSAPSKLTVKHKKLAELLLSMHIIDSPYRKFPSYTYHQLRKGIVCSKCYSYSVFIEKRNCICQECRFTEPVSNAVLRSVKEFKILFPDEKITTNIIHDWCQVVQSKKRISRILARNFKIKGVHQWAYYV